MRRTAAALGLAVLLMFPFALAQVAPGTEPAVSDTTATPVALVAAPFSGQTALDLLAKLIAALGPIVLFLSGMGLIKKYVPISWLQAIPNFIIPMFNSLIAFFAMFNGAPPAEAGVFGTLAHSLPWFAKVGGALFVGGVLPTSFYEVFLRGLLEWRKVFPANLSAAEKAAKAKVVGP